MTLDDRIIGVDSLADGNMEDIMFRKIDHVVDLIRGDMGTKVALKVEPAGAAPGVTKIITIDRGVVDLKDFGVVSSEWGELQLIMKNE